MGAHHSTGMLRGGVTRDPLLPELTAFAIESLPDATSKFKDKPFIPPHFARIRMQSNSLQADRDCHVNEVQKRALETTALKELHDEMNLARKKEHTTAAVETLSDACAACHQVSWDERCADSQAHIFGHI